MPLFCTLSHGNWSEEITDTAEVGFYYNCYYFYFLCTMKNLKTLYTCRRLVNLNIGLHAVTLLKILRSVLECLNGEEGSPKFSVTAVLR